MENDGENQILSPPAHYTSNVNTGLGQKGQMNLTFLPQPLVTPAAMPEVHLYPGAKWGAVGNLPLLSKCILRLQKGNSSKQGSGLAKGKVQLKVVLSKTQDAGGKKLIFTISGKLGSPHMDLICDSRFEKD